MTGIADVAREVNMSTATVSRALRDLPGVTPQTRALVLEAALRLGYTPSPTASRLASGRTRSVAVVMPAMNHWFFSTVANGAESALREHDYDTLIYHLEGSPTARQQVFDSNLLFKRVDGVLVLGMRPNRAELDHLERLGRPIVFVGTQVPRTCNIRIDDADAARVATLHLIGLGHRRIGHVGGPTHDYLDDTTPYQRQESFHATLAEHGLRCQSGWEANGEYKLDAGIEAGRRVLSAADRPTAVFCSSDVMAMGVLKAARELGLEVPGDLSVIGIDDHEMAEYFELTTIAQPAFEQGHRAVEILAEHLEGPSLDAALPPEQVVFPTALIVRGTTAPPRENGTVVP